ncbi:hypothetical protein FRC00_009312 [Tulasnella sp. 408]|nr:hypothetical protein FRC00_009312 [Tulasnella sp. 408]
MSPVQAAVLDMLPDLAAPYNRHATRPDGETKAAPVQHRDLLVKAKTGTGKTIAFLVPAIEARLNALAAATLKAEKDSGMKGDRRLSSNAEEAYARKNVGTLIISPTRELAIQIAAEALKLTKHHQHGVHLFVGGESKDRQIRGFERGRKDIVVATPGRLLDVMDSVPGIIESLENINTLVLDEADTLLDMGFRADIETILKDLPPVPKRQTFLFSATVSPAIRDIARKSLDKHHTFVNCVKEDDSPVHAHIPQYVTVLPSASQQLPHILNLITQDQLQNPGKSKVMIFCNTAKMTALLAEMLKDLRASLPQPRTMLYELHSGVTQNKRRLRSDDFRNDKSGAAVLITSDVSARGVDYPNVTRVIQLGVPATPDQYIHRVGRTGRGSNTSGRGDLVLLPFESRYPSRCLSAVPLQEMDAAKVLEENLVLASKFDSDPKAFFKGVDLSAPPRPQSRGRFERFDRFKALPQGPRVFPKDAQDRLQSMDEVIKDTLERQSPTETREAFAATAGFYIAVKDDLQLSGTRMYDALRDMHSGMFDEEAPQLSDRLKGMLGFNKKSPPIRARERSRDRGFTPRPRRDNEWTSSSPKRYGERGRSFEDRRPNDKPYRRREPRSNFGDNEGSGYQRRAFRSKGQSDNAAYYNE